jgi:hypothetical protein
MYSKTGGSGPLFCETGDETRSQDENCAEIKTEQTCVSTLIGPPGSFTPQFWICLPCAFTAAHFSLIKSKACENMICKIVWTDDTQFDEMVHNFAHFMATLKFKLWMKQGLESQTKAQRHFAHTLGYTQIVYEQELEGQTRAKRHFAHFRTTNCR